MKRMMQGLAWAGLVVAGCASAQVKLDDYLRLDDFSQLKLSPDGRHYAVSVPLDNRTVLAIVDRASRKTTGTFGLGNEVHVNDFWWANDRSVLITINEKNGRLDRPQPTGELYVVDVDGKNAQQLVGYRTQGPGLGNLMNNKQSESVAASFVGRLRGEDNQVLVAISPLVLSGVPYTRLDRMDVRNGRRATVASAPVRRGMFYVDNASRARFAVGADSDNVSKLYYRGSDGGDWKLINDEASSGHVEIPLGFSADDAVAYLDVQQASGPDAIVAWNPATGERKEVLRDAAVDPLAILYHDGDTVPVGAALMNDGVRNAFFDPAGKDARLYAALEKVAGGQAVRVVSRAQDGAILLLSTYSATNPGDFYLFERATGKLELLASRRQWIDPARAAEVTAFTLKARDGMDLHGYLTRPRGGGKRLPMVVVPHGGPYHEFDRWSFDGEAQLLAQAGYAVLQVNFRGSGNYGRAFLQAGAQQWGGTMQDDVTDATRWAVQQGIADPARICIYGASYGAYAALMGAAKEPSLYRCAAGYVGVYDLPIMFTRGDVPQVGGGETYLKEWIGDPKQLAGVSPVNLADRIKVPVFLAAGGEDQRAPILHSKRMEAALRRAGVPVETLYYDTEGHGFYTEPHQREYYTRLLAFLARALGGQQAAAAQP